MSTQYLEAFTRRLASGKPFGPLDRNLYEAPVGQESCEKARLATVRRATKVWDAFLQGHAGPADLTVMLRQVMRQFNCYLELPQQVLAQIDQTMLQSASLRIEEQTEAGVLLSARAWQCGWLADTAEIDRLEPRHFARSAIGDGLLYAMSQRRRQPFLTYRSEAQKSVVEAAMFASPGATLLITLPTGGGKSLCTLMPTWFATRGGRRSGGLTLVLVPTVALAYDQERAANEFFSHPAGEQYKPRAWTGETDEAARAMILRGIENDTLPLLFTSPEALLRKPALYYTCLRAAERGMLTRLVVDEAHLIDAWGASFRTDMQLLASYRRRLLQASGGQLITILQSATVPESTQALLKQLFANEHNFHMVIGNRLRPEPAFWFSYAERRWVQRERIVEGLMHLQRPAILYVTKPDDAEDWVRHLRTKGFQRVASFSGRTTGRERSERLAQWAHNELDIMVGTSAFGLGVDKADVRTVIHGTLPESIDRFYQEVGRGGRDGCSSVSLLIHTARDADLAERLASSSSRITVEKGWGRWQGMWNTSQPYQESGRLRLLNVDAPPTYNPRMKATDYNRDWNLHILTFMERAGLLAVYDQRPADDLEDGHDAEDGKPATEAYWVLIEVLDDVNITNEAHFSTIMEQQRLVETDQLRSGLTALRALADMYGSGQASHCLAHEISLIYPACANACGGCAYCRRYKIKPYAEPLRATSLVDFTPTELNGAKVNARLREIASSRHALIVSWGEQEGLEQLVLRLAEPLVANGIEQLILPEEVLDGPENIEKIVQGLAKHSTLPQRLLTDRLLLNGSELLPMPTAVFYPRADRATDHLYQTLQYYLPHLQRAEMLVVHVVRHGAFLASENKLFIDHVNGVGFSPEHFVRHLTTQSRRMLL